MIRLICMASLRWTWGPIAAQKWTIAWVIGTFFLKTWSLFKRQILLDKAIFTSTLTNASRPSLLWATVISCSRVCLITSKKIDFHWDIRSCCTRIIEIWKNYARFLCLLVQQFAANCSRKPFSGKRWLSEISTWICSVPLFASVYVKQNFERYFCAVFTPWRKWKLPQLLSKTVNLSFSACVLFETTSKPLEHQSFIHKVYPGSASVCLSL